MYSPNADEMVSSSSSVNSSVNGRVIVVMMIQGDCERVSVDPSEDVCILITKLIQEELGNLLTSHLVLPSARSTLIVKHLAVDLVLESLVSESGGGHVLCLN